MGQVHYVQVDSILEGEPVMMCMFSVAKHPAVVLFDSEYLS